MFIWLPKSRLGMSIPKPISLAETRDWSLKGREPFKLKSSKVKVSEGKCLKNESSESVKFNSPSRFSLARAFIFSVIVSAKIIGKIMRSARMLPNVIPLIFNIFRNKDFFFCSTYVLFLDGKVTIKATRI